MNILAKFDEIPAFILSYLLRKQKVTQTHIHMLCGNFLYAVMHKVVIPK